MSEVSVIRCDSYDDRAVRDALVRAIDAVGGLDFVKPGMRIGLKTNLVALAAPEKAVTTHPTVLRVLCDLLCERGATVVIGDSPGGLYTAAYVNRIYRACGLESCLREGVSLNQDFSQNEKSNPNARVARRIAYTAYLDNVDLIIDVCKLKTHGMMGMSCAAKNLFGVIPGTMKPEYHFRYPTYEQFADMILDLNDYFKPALAICDAVVGMEGNGPTAGEPRDIGCILASTDTHKLDLVAASIIGLTKEQVPTLLAAHRSGLIPDRAEQVDVFGDPMAYHVSGYKNIAVLHSLGFKGTSDHVIKNIFGGVLHAALSTRPVPEQKSCVGCNVCGNLCPAQAITMKNGKARIDKKKCIRCFCCQEFCPKGAMKVHRTFIAKLLNKGK